jgi:hypothetical protein
MARDAGRRLGLRRYVAYDLVPRRPGPLRIPELRIDYFDPGAGRYGTTGIPASRVEVVGVAASPAAAEMARGTKGSPEEPERPADEAPRSADRMLGFAALCALAALALAATSALLALRTRDAAAPLRRAALAALADARAADAEGRRDEAARALARALRLAFSVRLEGALALSSEELLAGARSDDERDAARLLARLDHARFGGAEPPSAAEVAPALARLASGDR